MSIQEARRAAFEAKFPVPEGIAWNLGYVVYHMRKCSGATYAMYLAKWEAWNAALDSAVVELPSLQEFCGPDGFYMDYLAPESVLEAIEAAGIRVEVKS